MICSVWKPRLRSRAGNRLDFSTNGRTPHKVCVLSSFQLDLAFSGVVTYSSSVWPRQGLLFFPLKMLFLLALWGKKKSAARTIFIPKIESPAEAINTSWNSEWKSIVSFSCLQWSEDYSNSTSNRLHELCNECKTKLDLVRQKRDLNSCLKWK